MGGESLSLDYYKNYDDNTYHLKIGMFIKKIWFSDKKSSLLIIIYFILCKLPKLFLTFYNHKRNQIFSFVMKAWLKRNLYNQNCYKAQLYNTQKYYSFSTFSVSKENSFSLQTPLNYELLLFVYFSICLSVRSGSFYQKNYSKE